jgi:hypothetical protein
VLSYSLIFSRDLDSRKRAVRLFAPSKVAFVGPDDRPPPIGSVVITNWDMYFGGQSPMLAHFPHYCGHFALVQKQMLEWKPHKFKDLFEPGYADRFTWYATMLGVVIAVVGIVGIVTSVISAVTGFVAMRAAQEGLILQKLQLNETVF